MNSDDDRPRGQGRPRDPKVDERVLAAAREIYAERGWSGFNFDVVARAARVGKDALYRRFDSRGDLLVAAMVRGDSDSPCEHALTDDASLRDYLIAVGRDYLNLYSRPGFGFLRLWVEQSHNTELMEAFHGVASLPEVSRVRGVIRRAIEAGILPEAASPTAILDGLVGGLLMHMLATPPSLRPQMLAAAEGYIEQLVDVLLRGVGFDEGAPGRLGDLRDPILVTDGNRR